MRGPLPPTTLLCLYSHTDAISKRERLVKLRAPLQTSL